MVATESFASLDLLVVSFFVVGLFVIGLLVIVKDRQDRQRWEIERQGAHSLDCVNPHFSLPPPSKVFGDE